MAKQTTTPLGYLMDMLYVQGTQLSNMVHVDRTVISRWRNGRSEFNMKSGYFDDVVNALIDINEKQGLQTLERFFSSVSHKTVQKRKDLQRHISTWLVSKDFDRQYKEQDSGNSLYSTSYKLYKGMSGKRDALNYFWERLNSLPGNGTVLGYDTNSRIFFSASADIKSMQSKMMQSQEKGDQIITLIYFNRPADQVYNMYQNWMNVFLSKNSHVYYTYDSHTPFYDYMYSIKGKLAIVGSNYDNDKGNLYSAIYEDPLTINQLDSYLEKLVDDFRPLINHMDNKDISVDFKDNDMLRLVSHNSDQYTYMEEPSFLFFNKDTTARIIGLLDVNFTEERKLNDFYNTSNIQSKRFFGSGGITRVVFSQENIDRLKKEEDTEIYFLSSLLGRRIKVPGILLLKEINNFVEKAEDNPEIDIAVRPYGSVPFFPGINLWVKENSIAYFYPSNDSSVRYSTTEFISVTSFFNAAKEYWDNLPYECKQADWISGQLRV